MKINSITSRLMLASALLLPAFLGLTGFFLLKAFESSLLEAENERLRGHIYLLFSVAELAEQTNARTPARLEMPQALMEPDFERLNSGLYAYIYNRKGELIWRSNSTTLLELPTSAEFSPSTSTGQLITQSLRLNDQPLFTAHYDVVWEDSAGQGHPFRFAIAHARTSFNAELRAYRTQLWRWLGAATFLLLIAQASILHWGLRPLSKLASALKAMQSGETQNIAGEHPRELQEVVHNLNQVLAREKALRQRYRNSLSDLAHSLKTPLAVLQSKLTASTKESDLQETLNEQVARMNQVVTYQLQRAVSTQQQGMHSQVAVDQVLQRLLSALHKVYRDKSVKCDLRVVLGTVFAGDEQDLMEILGNLLENAFKYCKQTVAVDARCAQQQLLVRIGDDGPGVPAEARSRILQRGQRLDTSLPGQGIGLAVAVDIINSYGGTLNIDTSTLGGAEFTIRLPLTNPLA
jgi:two-component system sensor histidine kinase PhoQ